MRPALPPTIAPREADHQVRPNLLRSGAEPAADRGLLEELDATAEPYRCDGKGLRATATANRGNAEQTGALAIAQRHEGEQPRAAAALQGRDAEQPGPAPVADGRDREQPAATPCPQPLRNAQAALDPLTGLGSLFPFVLVLVFLVHAVHLGGFFFLVVAGVVLVLAFLIAETHQLRGFLFFVLVLGAIQFVRALVFFESQ